MSSANAVVEKKITRDDIKGKLAELQSGVDEKVEGARTQMIAVGVIVLTGVIVVAFALGRRRGRRKSTIIEIRRS
ncbi:MAG: hypothetical protein JJLCMIEE_00320 [Acidimicrobiales bacterium]|nr:MAG: hypothetical protein EDR02_17625 [Actinomycetota bacterium]MBV6507279.1 hypothetical protein [Acidimicrobiales bacterium]RIK04111.1 MAG: hypothetical protein DCC48_14430 [Acidobacteriota bacterium]